MIISDLEEAGDLCIGQVNDFVIVYEMFVPQLHSTKYDENTCHFSLMLLSVMVALSILYTEYRARRS